MLEFIIAVVFVLVSLMYIADWQYQKYQAFLALVEQKAAFEQNVAEYEEIEEIFFKFLEVFEPHNKCKMFYPEEIWERSMCLLSEEGISEARSYLYEEWGQNSYLLYR